MKHSAIRYLPGCMFISFVLAVFVCQRATADEFHVTQEASVTSYYVHGDESRSFYPKNKIRYLYEGEADFKKVVAPESEIYGDVFFRATDDDLVDRQSASLEKIYLGYKGPGYDALLGDYYVSFTDYTLSNALKGGKVDISKEGVFRFISVGGIDTARWEDLWESRCEDSRPRRYVWGSRLETYHLDNALKVNLNYGGAWDDWAHFADSVPTFYGQVGSVDWMLEVNKNINLRGEMALSHSSPDARRSDVEKKFDDAFKAAVDLKDEMYESTTEYSRIGPNFNTTGGFSASDLESLLYDGLFYLPWDVTLIHYVHMDADNLKKTKSTTTKQINPGLKASFKLPFGLKTDLGWDMRKRYSTDRITGELTNVYSSGISKDLTICYLNARFSRTVVENYKQPEQDRARNSILVGLDGDFEVRGVRFSWDLSEDLQLEQYPKIGSCKQDFLMTHSGGLKTVFPSTLTLDGRISFNDNNYYIKSTDSHVNKYHFSISRDLIKDLIISFNYDQNDYYYAGGDGNYFEIVMAGKINLRF